LLAETETGPSRLKAGLGRGWTLAHKTGTGQVMGPVATGFNDVGIMTAPDGHAYAVAVMIAQTRTSVPAREALMVEVARAVVAHHDRAHGL
jgi:beta-lactamase class A